MRVAQALRQIGHGDRFEGAPHQRSRPVIAAKSLEELSVI